MSTCYLTLAISAIHGPFHNPVTGARYTATEMAVLFHVIARPRFAAHYPPSAFNWRGVFGETVRRDAIAQYEGSS